MIEEMAIIAGSRNSPLARAQVAEVQAELANTESGIKIKLTPLWLMTAGDHDRTTSLRDLDKSDFFTKEIDDALLANRCRIGIHAAKDLPAPLPAGIIVAALTNGVDSSDALVMRDGCTIASLPVGALIATSSPRREAAVQQLRAGLSFCDIRGTIHERLAVLSAGAVAGVVIAEAALIRLGLTQLNRCRLPGATAEGQGKLALTVRADDKEMIDLLACIDSRRCRR